ncbi:MAG: aminomethyl-transferring glycine dehydrogenase [Bdellovibrionales bacterium]|nr:aminomethyl-transferring glycine dehydrogenase [Bdellovibrionales bacterium]
MQKNSFVDRHVGPRKHEIDEMLKFVVAGSLDQLVQETVPQSIRLSRALELPPAMSESEALSRLGSIMEKNRRVRSYIGMGYYDCITPPVIQRNILENPGWYTQYTPYQAEISQGRLEALLNFQTMIIELTGLPIANASLLDEGTAAAEAMTMCFGLQGRPDGKPFLLSSKCHPQTIEIVCTRAAPLGIKVEVSDPSTWNLETQKPFAILVQYPNTDGSIEDPRKIFEQARQLDVRTIVAADLLSLVLLVPPGELGADVAVGTTQRFGVPVGFGGPHAAYISTRDDYKRLIPGRIVGVSQDTEGRPAIRLALQTREQHIRRDKATSNICTAQVLLAVMASMYAVYHGPAGLRGIAEQVNQWTRRLDGALKKMGYQLGSKTYFDTLWVRLSAGQASALKKACEVASINLRWLNDSEVTVSMDESVTEEELKELVEAFAVAAGASLSGLDSLSGPSIPNELARQGPSPNHPIFNRYHSETEMLRYIRRLEARDLSLTNSMIPLGSCTMKLNATAEMFPVSWPSISRLHPFVPAGQADGYHQMMNELSSWLAEITGLPGVSLQPNAGSQGEYAGLLAIRRYHLSRGEGHRTVCLIPKSAHGTNPASAVMAGMQVVVVECDEQGNVDLADLRAKAIEHGKSLAALMVTYPSTHGVFEEAIREICSVVHDHGGQVYMDGANMNAQVGLCRPGDFGPDVCHLNLHKTFCIPHGGGGPGMGPICVAKHLIPFLPGHSQVGSVSSAPWGSASILPISWMYIAMMGAEGLKRATEVAILSANYLAKKLGDYYPVLYTGKNGRVAHECILDLRPLKQSAGIEVEDVAKRLMDYGFHAPTVSFPVAGTIMIEPTESESLAELNRFCEAMIAIRKEIAEIEQGLADRSNNVLKHAPHTARVVCDDRWDRPYSREKAAFPAAWTREAKFWPSVSRVNAVQGDRNLICACPPMESYQS